MSLLWCGLLIVVLPTFLWCAYAAVETTLLRAGVRRAQFAAQQVGPLLARAAQQRHDGVMRAAADDAIRQCLDSPTAEHLAAVRARVTALATAVPHRISLWTAAGPEVFAVIGPSTTDAAGSRVTFPPVDLPSHSGQDRLRGVDGMVFYQTASHVPAPAATASAPGPAAPPMGYLVYQSLVVSPRSSFATSTAGLIGRLVGGDATMAFGNIAGDVWTDLARQVSPPPVDLTREHATEYAGADGVRYVGAIVPIPDTPWAMAVAFPRPALVAPARAMLRSGTAVALVCLGVGAGAIAVIVNRTTRPLVDLAQAAQDIAGGNYRRRVTAAGASSPTVSTP